MYTEIIKIIEGGLKSEPQKVVQYARKLADKFDLEGNGKLAKGIRSVLDSKGATTLSMEQLITTAPVDNDTRLSIVDLYNPAHSKMEIVLPDTTERKVADFIEIIENRDRIRSFGLPMQSTLLLYGAPGVGKTSIAKFISAQTGLPLVIARLDTLISSLLGNTAKNIRKIFEYADSKPCILFLDEFDAIAKARDDQHEMGELKRVINSLLQNIDMFAQNNILIAATNHPELLDKAIWRRFNSVIEIGQPNTEGVSRLVALYTGDFGREFLADKRKTEKIAHLLSKKTPADIQNIINAAITRAIIKGKDQIGFEDILIENFQFDKHGSFTSDEFIKYLDESGVPKLQIADILNVSIRQIRNNLKD